MTTFCPNRDPRSSAGYICRASLPLPIPLLKGSVRFGVVTVGAFSDHLSVRRQAKQEDQDKRHHEGQANEPYENAHEQPSDRGKCRQPSEGRENEHQVKHPSTSLRGYLHGADWKWLPPHRTGHMWSHDLFLCFRRRTSAYILRAVISDATGRGAMALGKGSRL